MATETVDVKIPKELLIGIEKKKLVEEIKLFTAMRFYESKELYDHALELAHEVEIK
ncbi:MAG: hypothetical protein KAT65_23715 [Methanophagales archaeon]|nr:hypothetical protein [Methanophagales archaeon]